MRVIIIFFIFTLLLTPCTAQTTLQAEVSAFSLHVRTQPSTTAESLGQIPRETLVTIIGRSAESPHWVFISAPIQGWVNADYLIFPTADWRDQLPVVDINLPSTSEPLINPLPPYQATVNTASGLRVRETPVYNGTVLGTLPLDAQVTVHGRMGDCNNGWLYVTQNNGNLAGWVARRYLDLSPHTDLWLLPLLADGPFTPLDPIRTQGQVIAYVTWKYGLHLRTAPNLDAEILVSLRKNAFLQVHGKALESSEGRWLFVTVQKTGQTGWVFQEKNYPRYVGFPKEFDLNSLPTLEPIMNPAVPAPPPALDSVTITLSAEAVLRAHPWRKNAGNGKRPAIVQTITPGTPITLIGRTPNSLWLMTMINGREAWLYYDDELVLPIEVHRLPITSLRGGTYQCYFPFSER